MQAGTRRGRRRSSLPRRAPLREARARSQTTGAVLLFDLAVAVALLVLAASSAGWMMLLCPLAAGLIMGCVSAYYRCALLSLLVLLVCLTGFVVLWRAEPGFYQNLNTVFFDMLVGIGLVAGWTVGAIVGYLAQRSARQRA